MATQARSGKGTKMQVYSGGSYVDIGEVVSAVDRTGAKLELIDVTNQDSPIVGGQLFKEFIGGTTDPGDVKFTVNWVPGNSGQVALKAALGISTDFKIVYPGGDGHSDSFTGIAQLENKSAPIDKQITSAFSIKISGAVTEA